MTEHETKRARVTASMKRDMAATLRTFHAANEAKKAADSDYRRARKAVEAIPDGQYVDMIKTYGNPRTITDNDAVAKRYEELGEMVPTKLAYPIVVRVVETS